jgi:hypothetical protein
MRRVICPKCRSAYYLDDVDDPWASCPWCGRKRPGAPPAPHEEALAALHRLVVRGCHQITSALRWLAHKARRWISRRQDDKP